jgi:hypothetical protein
MADGIFGFAGGNSGNGGGDFLDIIKVSVEARMINRMDYDGTSNMPYEITDKFKAVFDMEQLQVGWAKFSETGPSFAMSSIEGGAVPACPAEDYKAGFKCTIKLGKECADPNKTGGDIREFATNSRYLRDSMSELWEAYKAERQPGKLPVVRLKEWKKETTVSKKFPSKTFFRPIWEIVSWVDRPADLPLKPASDLRQSAQHPAQASAPSTGSTVVGAPAAKQPELADADDFG